MRRAHFAVCAEASDSPSARHLENKREATRGHWETWMRRGHARWDTAASKHEHTWEEEVRRDSLIFSAFCISVTDIVLQLCAKSQGTADCLTPPPSPPLHRPCSLTLWLEELQLVIGMTGPLVVLHEVQVSICGDFFFYSDNFSPPWHRLCVSVAVT